MITYNHASLFPEAFQQVFGCTVAAFDTLYAEFEVAYEQRLAQSTLTRRKAVPRKRRPGAGRHFKHPLRERLLLALFWLRVFPTLELLGVYFSLDKTSAEDNLKDVLATLETLVTFIIEYPGEHHTKRHTVEQINVDFPDLALLVGSRMQDRSTLARESQKWRRRKMNLRENVEKLTELVRTGKADEAYLTFYIPDVIMQENSEPPRTSLQASIDRQTQATNGVTVNEFAPRSIVVEGDHAAIEWVIDITAPDGSHIHIEELALQTWKDGKIVRERFYYDPKQFLPTPPAAKSE